METIAGRIVVITGASAGLGAESARHLLKKGSKAMMSLRQILGIVMCATSFASAADSSSQTNESAVTASAQQITHAGEQAPIYGPAEHFTGRVRVDPLFASNDSINASGAYVTFEPGARSAWHTHPAGQHLVVTSGIGLTQEWGKTVQIIRQGDVIWCPPGVKHWHGAAPNSAMIHLAVGRAVDGKTVTWMEKVTDDQYNAH